MERKTKSRSALIPTGWVQHDITASAQWDAPQRLSYLIVTFT